MLSDSQRVPRTFSKLAGGEERFWRQTEEATHYPCVYWRVQRIFAGSLHVGNNVSVPSFSWLKSMSQVVGLTATWQDKVEGNPMAVDTASNAKVNINPVHTEFNFFL